MARHCHHLRPSSRPREPATTPSARGLIASSTHQNRRSPRNPDWDLSGQTTGTSVSERSRGLPSCFCSLRNFMRRRVPNQRPNQDGTETHPPPFHRSAPLRSTPTPLVSRSSSCGSRRVARRPRPKEPVGVGPGADPPVRRTSFGTPLPSPFHSSFHVRAGVAPGRTDPCGKARRPRGAS